MTDTHILNETSGETLARLGTDGALWADAFAAVARHHADLDPLDSTPGDLLHVYFVNAIEAGRSAGYGPHMAETEELRGKLDGANATWQRAQRKLDAIRALAANYATLPSDEYIGAAYDLRKILDSDD
jgi:hypothetical protein